MKQLKPLEDKRRAKGEVTRKLILDSAISTIATLGLGNTTLDRVAEHSGVSRALVVFHFKSKHLLVKESLELLCDRYAKGWDSVAATKGGTTMEKILRFTDFDIGYASENPEYISAWHAFWGESKGNKIYRELGVPEDKRFSTDIEELLAQYIDEGGYDKNELPSIITGLNAMLFGLWLESHLDPKPDDLESGIAAVRFFLAKVFPKHPLPPIYTKIKTV